MSKATFPNYRLTNTLDKLVHLKQAELIQKEGRNVSLQEVYKMAGDFCEVRPHTISMIKSGVYKPSIILALLMAQFFNTTVDNMFGLESIN